MSGSFVEVADRVLVLREPLLAVNVTLVLGDGEALLVDTLSTVGQAVELRAAVRAVTGDPLTLVNTHHHFDHCFGNAALAGDPPRPIWAHELAATALCDDPERLRREAYAELRDEHPELADELAEVTVLAPTHTVHTEATLDIGGRQVVLRHPGRGHTDADLVVHVPDADVLVAGDLVEQSGPPAFEDSYPLQWPEAVAELLRWTTDSTVVVPGHGTPVDTEFVRAQHAQLVELAWLIRAGHTGSTPPERVAADAPFPARPALLAAHRGYAELDGTA
ncbi:MBL fold metallo-hydrolase [Micromonospora maris]|uniref:MBL fold metallo-hydrolase n=1 Tax=Micromonospora maris TaxID=1003110 RepID=A0A9X0LCX8_9ACTN|nr:MBL fold metallo-hydrolase [Micromonospora maris]AEB46238.1 beta-lactamase domain-containing protein [Micromonospora maris AB-18-032]KUJ45491.1 MBL fold metallo-hydrolase [Micromonospora maris]